MISNILHRQILTNGLHLHVVLAGPEEGMPVILLHGFPEFWYGWRHQIPALAEAGYRVWVPDQRGYNLSDKPRGITAYTLDALSGDILGLIEATGREKAVVVGHDWGGAVAWWLAGLHPERIEKLIILNSPHGTVMRRHLRRNLRQLRRSWYFLFFQIPFLPERLMRLGNWVLLTRTLIRTSRKGTFSPADLEHYRAAWSKPGAMTAMINWYRAVMQKRPHRIARREISVPTLLIWGVRDAFLGVELAQPSIEFCSRGRLELIDGATHWVAQEEPKRVNRLMLNFLNTH
ncbi:MAG: alpha/beta hydrolase [Calditrichaeota bacterium]|nr:MAG: alpha/beta hydrolase [Calditrichota bacterium]